LIAAVKRIAEALEKIEVRLASIETSQEKLVKRPFWGAYCPSRRIQELLQHASGIRINGQPFTLGTVRLFLLASRSLYDLTAWIHYTNGRVRIVI
jgi:hypothetical protein